MIRVTITIGEWAGRTREFNIGDVEPRELFGSLVSHGDKWVVDYSTGTEEEAFLWFRAELAARIIRALAEGRPVRFLDSVWTAEPGSVPEVAQRLEDALVTSGRLVTIDADDENGLTIGVRGWES